MTRQKIYEFMMVDARPHPIERRLKEFSKLLRKHLTKQAASDVESWLNETCDGKVERICQSPDSPARREKLKKLFDQRDEQIQARTHRRQRRL